MYGIGNWVRMIVTMLEFSVICVNINVIRIYLMTYTKTHSKGKTFLIENVIDVNNPAEAHFFTGLFDKDNCKFMFF